MLTLAGLLRPVQDHRRSNYVNPRSSNTNLYPVSTLEPFVTETYFNLSHCSPKSRVYADTVTA